MTFSGNKKKKAISANPRSSYTPLGNMDDEIEKPSKKDKKEKKKKEPKLKAKKEPQLDEMNLDILASNREEQNTNKNFIVPNAFNSKNIKKMGNTIPTVEEAVKNLQKEPEEKVDLFDLDSENEQDSVENRIDEVVKEEPIIEPLQDLEPIKQEPVEEPQKKKRGRPKKVLTPEEQAELEAKQAAPKKRGRPKKVAEAPVVEEKLEEPVDLFGLSEEPDEPDEVVDLFSLSNDEEKENIIDEIEEQHEQTPINYYDNKQEDDFLIDQVHRPQDNLSNLLTKDRKVAK